MRRVYQDGRDTGVVVSLRVATTATFSNVSMTLRAGTTGLCGIPAGTVNACRGPNSTVPAIASRR